MKKKIVIVIISILVLLLIYLIADQYVITKTQYTVESDRVNSEIKIAVISDLHNMNFFNNNQEVVDKISSENPDIIAVVGDMIDENSSNAENTLNTIKPLPDIAPTYYSIGNHDKLYSDYNTYIFLSSPKRTKNLLGDFS